MTPKQRLPQSLGRAADLPLSSWRGRTVALDFAIITPTQASVAIKKTSTTSSTPLMGQAADLKLKKKDKRSVCSAADWLVPPFVADTCGTLWSDARNLVSRFIKNHHHRFSDFDTVAGKVIWSAE